MIEPREKITAVVLDHDGGELALRCARSFAAQTMLPSKVLFIDNGGARFNEGQVREAFGPRFEEKLEFLKLPTNMGYARGFNAGLRKLVSEKSGWILTLNNDTELDPDFFERLDQRLRGLPARVGSVSPKVRSALNRDCLDTTGLLICLDGMSTARGQYERDAGQYDNAYELLAPSGVAAVYRTRMLLEVGLLDEDFDFYCEDTDLGLRAWLAGWDCRYVPECVVYHVRSASTGMFSLRKLYLVERNHYWVAIKTFPLLLLLLNPLFTVLRFAAQFQALWQKKGLARDYAGKTPVLKLFLTTLRGMGAAFLGMPKALAKRRQVFRLRRRSIFSIFLQLWKQRLSFGKLIFNGDQKSEKPS